MGNYPGGVKKSQTQFDAYFVISLVLNIMDSCGNTPLHWAAEKNQVESVKFLLSQGANPNLRNSTMMAPLHIAVQYTYNEMIKVRLLPTGGGADLTHFRKTNFECHAMANET